MWDFRQLQQNLDANILPELLLVSGQEQYLVSESLRLIKSKGLEGLVRDFNYDEFWAGTDSKIENILNALETLPVMSPYRFIIFRQAHLFKEAQWKVILPVILKYSDQLKVVFFADKVDKRKSFYKTINKSGKVVELAAPYDNQVPPWVHYMAASLNLSLSKDIAALFQQIVGNQLSDLHAELKKLSDYIGYKDGADKSERKVTKDHVLTSTTHLRVNSIFQLTEAIGKRDRVEALTCLANLLANGQNEIATMSMIHRHLKILALVKKGLSEGLAGKSLSSKAGVSPYFLKQYLAQSQQWNLKKITKTMDELHKTDKALKSSPLASHVWLENFILQSCEA